MSVEMVLLRNQILDFRDSEHQCEANIGQFLHEHTDKLEGQCFVIMVLTLLEGLRLSLEHFEDEWKVDR